MFLHKVIGRSVISIKYSSVRFYAKNQNPMLKTWDTLAKDLFRKKTDITYPEHADIVIIGGGLIGASVAYWLKTRAGIGLSVVVLEKDFTYKNFNSNLYCIHGNLQQHYSLPENIHLSQFSAEFFRNIKQNLNSDVELEYYPTGSLILASEKYAEKLEHNVKVQQEFGLKNELLSVSEIKRKFPWITTHDVKLGCLSSECEGTYNMWALLKALVQKAEELGAVFVNADVVGFEMEKQRDLLMEGVAPGSFEKIVRVVYRTPDNDEYAIKFAGCILAAGDKSTEIAKLAKIGTGDGMLTVPMPIERRENRIYSIEHKALETGLNTPTVMDTSGLWLRRNGLENNLLCGHIPIVSLNPKDVLTEDYYQNIIKPAITNRAPTFRDAKITNYATEVYDYNTHDETGIIGPHSYHNNLYIAAGFGKEGAQHAPALGRAIAELIIDGNYVNIDLTRFGFDRFLMGEPMIETNIY